MGTAMGIPRITAPRLRQVRKTPGRENRGLIARMISTSHQETIVGHSEPSEESLF
jgi:hypothetical protein